MALPGNITLITLTGQYLDFQGAPIDGQVKIYPSQVLIDSAADRIIIPSVLTTDLNDGAFSVQVPVTNDPDAVPFTGIFTYLFEEAFVGGSTYRITLPSSLGSSVDITDIRLDATIVEYIQPIAYQVWPPIQARTEAQEVYYTGVTIPVSTLPIPVTYEWLYLYFDTYASLASTWGTYANAAPASLSLSNARIQQIYDRMNRLNNYTATSTDLRETTNLGVVSESGNYAVTAKLGTYANVANQYANYVAITGATFTWTYAQGGTLIGQMGNALTTVDIYDLTGLTDPLLSLTRTIQGNDYGALFRTFLTNAQVASTYSTYQNLQSASFSNTLRDWADRLRSTANRPHQLLTRSYQYGINI